MNVNQLQPPPPPQLQRFSKEESDKDADVCGLLAFYRTPLTAHTVPLLQFLALRLLNKRSRLRLSPQPVELDAIPGKGRLFAVSNTRGWFVAATRNVDGSHGTCSAVTACCDTHIASSPCCLAPRRPPFCPCFLIIHRYPTLTTCLRAVARNTSHCRFYA